MRLLFFLLLVGIVVAAFAARNEPKKPLVMQGKQQRWTAEGLKAYHEQMRKVHKNYIAYYPDVPILTNISVGTPPVDYQISLESGSELIFLLAKDYPGRNTSINQPFYDPAQSSTSKYVGGYDAFFGNMEAFGSSYDDVVGLFGNGAQYNATQRIGVVNDIQDVHALYPPLPDGALGLSWNPDDAADPSEATAPILNLFKEFGDLPRFWCQWIEGHTDPVLGREYSALLSYGDYLTDYCEAPTAQLTRQLVWNSNYECLEFGVDSFAYKGELYNGHWGRVDSGVPNILLPYDWFLPIYQDVFPDYEYDYGVYSVPCSWTQTLPDWVFTIGGQTFSIPAKIYVVDLNLPNNKCVLSTQMTDDDTTVFVLGYPFFAQWCIKMDIDNQAISFMKVRRTSLKQSALEQ